MSYHDPHVSGWKVDADRVSDEDLPAALAKADLVVLVQNHSAYDIEALVAGSRRFFDTRGVAVDPAVHRL